MSSSFHRAGTGRRPFALARPAVFVAVAALVLSACGGNGDPEVAVVQSPPPPAVTPLTFTEANAKAAASSVFIAAAMSQLLVNEILAEALRTVSKQLPAGDAKAAVSYTVPCAGGGSIDVTGTVAVTGKHSPGDQLTTQWKKCITQALGKGAEINGAFSTSVISADATTTDLAYDIKAFGFHGVVEGEPYSVSISGDLRQKTTTDAASNTNVVVYGKSIALAYVYKPLSSRALECRDFRYATVSSPDELLTRSFDTTMELRDSQLGTTPVTFTVSTLDLLTSSMSNAGRLRLHGANDLMINAKNGANNPLTLELDKDGNGTIDSTIVVPMQEVFAAIK